MPVVCTQDTRIKKSALNHCIANMMTFSLYSHCTHSVSPLTRPAPLSSQWSYLSRICHPYVMSCHFVIIPDVIHSSRDSRTNQNYPPLLLLSMHGVCCNKISVNNIDLIQEMLIRKPKSTQAKNKASDEN